MHKSFSRVLWLLHSARARHDTADSLSHLGCVCFGFDLRTGEIALADTRRQLTQRQVSVGVCIKRAIDLFVSRPQTA